ncbi:MAG: DUF6362 family protein [Magnetospirillum sp. WYHS-4]
MADRKWTAKMVEDRIEEAADTLRRLPEQKVQGFFGTWPPVVRDFWEAFGWEEARIRRGPPQPGAIDRMDEVMIWLTWLEADDARIVWLRACRTPWKLITWRFGMSRTTAWRNWVAALLTIAARLDGASTPRRTDDAA